MPKPAGESTIVFLSMLGIPLSTTHTITGQSSVPVRYSVSPRFDGIARNIVWAWILTIPCSALIGALLEFAARPFLS